MPANLCLSWIFLSPHLTLLAQITLLVLLYLTVCRKEIIEKQYCSSWVYFVYQGLLKLIVYLNNPQNPVIILFFKKRPFVIACSVSWTFTIIPFKLLVFLLLRCICCCAVSSWLMMGMNQYQMILYSFSSHRLYTKGHISNITHFHLPFHDKSTSSIAVLLFSFPFAKYMFESNK